MKPINKEIVKLKHLIGIIPNPTYEDLLYEIVNFLNNELRFDGEFKMREVSLKTRVRINLDVNDDVDKLVELGYVEKLKYSSYIVLKHLWQ